MFFYQRNQYLLQYQRTSNKIIEMSHHRAFSELIQKIGAQGKYQNISLIFWSICFLTCGASTYFNAFLFYQEKYSCPSNIQNCQQYVCTLSENERAKFISPSNHTFLSKFGDYRCDSNIQIDSMQSFIYMGGLVGVLVGSFINQYITKRRLLLLTVILNIVGIAMTILSDSLFLASVGLFINYAAKAIQSQVIPCIITQTVSQDSRGKHVMIGYFFYGLGVTLNGAIFMVFSDWQLVLFLYQFLPFIAMFWGLFYFIEETPFDSIVNYSPQQSLQVFQRIALMNEKTDHGLTLQSIEQIKRQYEENQNSKHSSVITVVDLFRYDSLRFMAILSIILQFLISYQFNVPQLIIKDYALDIYLAGIILGSSEVLSSMVCYFIVNSCERKKLIYIVQALGILVSVPIFIFASCGESVEECGVFTSVMQIVGIFLFRFFVTIGYNIFYMSQYEMFPTQIRSLAIQFTSSICVLAVVISPMLQSYFKEKGISMIITFSVSCLLIMAGAIKMPETYKIPPPEIIQELKVDDKTYFNESIIPNPIKNPQQINEH